MPPCSRVRADEAALEIGLAALEIGLAALEQLQRVGKAGTACHSIAWER